MLQTARDNGAETENVVLREYPIEFCHNCRACTQEPGDQPAACVIDDGMQALIAKIEHADAFILAAPVNYGSATAVFKRFMERLTVYAYWPWGAPGPKYRKAQAPRKKALLVSSSAAPGPMGLLLYGVRKQLRMTARTIGADPVGTLFTGLVSQQAAPGLSQKTRKRAAKLVRRLL
jgi:multimeric flavodoxin WrbA